jgi:uncharacterized protein (TIGR02058 family)
MSRASARLFIFTNVGQNRFHLRHQPCPAGKTGGRDEVLNQQKRITGLSWHATCIYLRIDSSEGGFFMLKRYLIEFGTGIDQHGQDPTRAAQKAVKDAISHSYLTGLKEILELKDLNKMVVKVKVAVPYPERVCPEEVLKVIPFGEKSLEVVHGGLLTEGMALPELGDVSPEILMANAAVTVWVEVEE